MPYSIQYIPGGVVDQERLEFDLTLSAHRDLTVLLIIHKRIISQMGYSTDLMIVNDSNRRSAKPLHKVAQRRPEDQ